MASVASRIHLFLLSASPHDELHPPPSAPSPSLFYLPRSFSEQAPVATNWANISDFLALFTRNTSSMTRLVLHVAAFQFAPATLGNVRQLIDGFIGRAVAGAHALTVNVVEHYRSSYDVLEDAM